jgi:hypothetical protein
LGDNKYGDKWVAYNFGDVALAIRTCQPVLVTVPFVRTVVAIDDIAAGVGIEMPVMRAS